MQRFKFSAAASCILLLFFIGCKPKKFVYKSPPHYNFREPQPLKLDLRIREVSGIIWDTHNNQFIAHNDEKGSLYFLDRGTGAIMGNPYTFNETKGDYEDIAMIGKDIYVLRSDGALYKIVTDSLGNRNTFDLGKIGLATKNDFETLYYDPERKALVMLCKNCESDEKKAVSAFAYYPDSIGFVNTPIFSIDVNTVDSLSPRKTSRLQPSAARIHPILKKLFILSSASNQLVIADTNGNVEAVYMLAKNLFAQPEGLTFKNNGEMYISNEGVSAKATLVKFVYIP